MSNIKIPQFDQGELFVYFNSLRYKSQHPPGIGMITKKLYGTANSYFRKNAFNPVRMTNQRQTKTIKQALTFLGQVASNERLKEIRLVENYINEIYQQIPEKLRKSRTMEQILDNLKQTSKDLSKKENIKPEELQGRLDNFYKELTTYINLVRQSADELKDRVNQLLDDTVKSNEELKSRSYLYRVDDDIENALYSSIGIAAKDTADTFSKMISETIMDHLSKGLLKNFDIQDNFHAILSGMIVDFENYLQSYKAKNNFSLLNNNYKRKDIQAIFKNYLNDSNTYFSNEMRKVADTGKISNSFQMALDNFSNRIGLSFFNRKSDIQKRLNAIANQNNDPIQKLKHGDDNYISKKLKQLNLDQIIKDNQLIRITTKTNTRHGTMFEAVQSILYGAFSTTGHPATDTVDIGEIMVEIDNQGIQDIITARLGIIADEIKATDRQIRKTRKDNTVRQLQLANMEIQQQADEINRMVAPLLKQENKQLFIYHESLKLYAEMEQSSSSGQSLKRKVSQFDGRTLGALNLVDILYSMDDGTNSIGLIDRTALAGAMLNLSEYAVGGKEKTTIANYLAIFTGMIMFSDLTNMAMEIGSMASAAVSGNNNDATHVHLYDLNGTYVPGSMLLTYIHKSLIELGTSIDISSFAQVHINTSGADQIIKQYETDRANGVSYDKNKSWNEVAEAVSQGTKVKITFMGTFLNLISQIGSIF